MCENYAGKSFKKRILHVVLFCEAFSRNNKSVAVVSFITQNGLVIAGMNYGCYEYIIFRDIYLHNLNGVAENVSILTAPDLR